MPPGPPQAVAPKHVAATSARVRTFMWAVIGLPTPKGLNSKTLESAGLFHSVWGIFEHETCGTDQARMLELRKTTQRAM